MEDENSGALLTLDAAYRKLVKVAYEVDGEEQRKFLSVIEGMRKFPSSYLIKRGCLFVPNAGYIELCLGHQAQNNLLGFYYNGEPLWQLYFIFPIENLAGTVVGIVGWDAYGKYKEMQGDFGLTGLYKVSSKAIFHRERYFMCDVDVVRGEFERASEGSRVIFVVDGVFDGVSLCQKGVPTICLLGSSISKEIIYFLKFYDYIYVLHDNDAAGIRLAEELKRVVPNVYCVTQRRTKDIEELVRVDFGVIEQLKTLIQEPIRQDVDLDGRRVWKGVAERRKV